MSYHVHDTYPNIPALPGEAEQIELMRRELVRGSNGIRLGNDYHPKNTVSLLSRTALALAASRASMFTKLNTLNMTEANLRGGGLRRYNMRVIAGLSQEALKVGYSRTNQLNRTDIAVRRRAIEHTTPELPFSRAMEEAWVHFGHPIDAHAVTQGQSIRAAHRAIARERHLNKETGLLVYDPFANYDEDEAPFDE